MSENVIIISSGRLGDPSFFQKRLMTIEDYFVICCDGGIRHLKNLPIRPDVIIGDMDSVIAEQLENYEALGTKIIRYPADKNETDTQLALQHALESKPLAIEIWGALGGRVDHTLANIFLLKWGDREEVAVKLIDEFCEVFIVSGEAALDNSKEQTVSLFALESRARGVTLRGFRYPMDNATLEENSPRGISNVIITSPATIMVQTGKLLVIHYWQKDVFPEVDR